METPCPTRSESVKWLKSGVVRSHQESAQLGGSLHGERQSEPRQLPPRQTGDGKRGRSKVGRWAAVCVRRLAAHRRLLRHVGAVALTSWSSTLPHYEHLREHGRLPPVRPRARTPAYSRNAAPADASASARPVIPRSSFVTFFSSWSS